eukprot:3918134-Pleurochrysis_carterae.AAC.1
MRCSGKGEKGGKEKNVGGERRSNAYDNSAGVNGAGVSRWLTTKTHVGGQSVGRGKELACGSRRFCMHRHA